MLFSLGTALGAKADPLIFSLDGPSSYTALGAGAGIGQAVTVSENLSINDVGLFLVQLPVGTVDYFIYDATTSSLILGPDAVSAPTKGWDYVTGLSVDLIAGDTYYFGAYNAGTGTLSVGRDPNTDSFTDGLGIPSGISSLYFAGDAPTATAGTGDLALRIESTDPPGDAPEPSSLILLGTGMLAGAVILRRKLAR